MAKESCGSASTTKGSSHRSAIRSSSLENTYKERRQEVSNHRDEMRHGVGDSSASRAPDRKRERNASCDNSTSASPGTAATELIVPRSRAEADILDGTNNTSRHRQLPCRTFISTGFCPYKEHCVYLHDPRLISSHQVPNRTRAKNKEDVVVDSFFWPMLKYNSKSVRHEYDVPAPEKDDYERHDEAVYSIWQHYVDFCLLTKCDAREPHLGNKRSLDKASVSSETGSLAVIKAKYSHRNGIREPLEQQKFDSVNRYISKERLMAFKTLSHGLSVPIGAPEALNSAAVMGLIDTARAVAKHGLPTADCATTPAVNVGPLEVPQTTPIFPGLSPGHSPSTVSPRTAASSLFTSPEHRLSAYTFKPIALPVGSDPGRRALATSSVDSVPIPPPGAMMGHTNRMTVEAETPASSLTQGYPGLPAQPQSLPRPEAALRFGIQPMPTLVTVPQSVFPLETITQVHPFNPSPPVFNGCFSRPMPSPPITTHVQPIEPVPVVFNACFPPAKTQIRLAGEDNDQTERDNTVREVLGPLRLDAPSGLPELEDGNDCDGLRPTPPGNSKSSPRPHRVHGKLRGDPVSTPVSESWWANNATTAGSRRYTPVDDEPDLERTTEGVNGDHSEWLLPGKGPSGSKSPRISVTMNSSEASLAQFKRERVINEDHREVNEDDYLNILTAHANLRLSGAQETLFTPLVSQLDDLMPAKVPMSMTSCGTQQHAVSPKAAPKVSELSPLARTYELRASVEGAVACSLLSPPPLEDNDLPNIIFSPRVHFPSRDTCVLEEGELQEKRKLSAEDSGRHAIGIEPKDDTVKTSKLHLTRGSCLEVSPRAASCSSENSVDSEMLNLSQPCENEGSPDIPLDQSTALAPKELFPPLSGPEIPTGEQAYLRHQVGTALTESAVNGPAQTNSPCLPVIDSLEGHCTCDQPGLDIVASVDDFSDMRAFLTPSPSTIASARMAPPKLQRHNLFEVHNEEAPVMNIPPSSTPTSNQTTLSLN